MVRVVVPELALEAGLPVTGLTRQIARHPHDLVYVIYVHHELAAYRAVCADGLNLGGCLLPFVITLHKRTGWAGIYTGTTELTTGLK